MRVPAAGTDICNQIMAARPVDLAQCNPGNVTYTLGTGTPPQALIAKLHPASHLVFATNPSGSLAGRVGALKPTRWTLHLPPRGRSYLRCLPARMTLPDLRRKPRGGAYYEAEDAMARY